VSARVVLRDVARAEFEESAAWYEAQRPGLGATFIAEVEQTLARIEQSPLAFQIAHRGLRCARVRRFPYSVIYQLEPTRILVFAVFHAKRNPARWRGRA